MQSSILFPDQYYCIAPRGLAGAYHCCIQHVPEQDAYLIKKWWRDALELLFEGLTIINADFMLYHTCAFKLISIQHVDVMEGQDELSCGSHVPWSPITEAIQV